MIETQQPGAHAMACRAQAELYAARRFRTEGVLSIGTSRFKFYLIESCAHRLSANPLKEAVREYAESHDDTRPAEGGMLGHVIVHRGDAGYWLLIHWWIPGGILRGAMAWSGEDELCFRTAEQGLLGCVWELQVVEHERIAWIRHMMQEVPNVAAFLKDRMPSGAY